MGRDCPSRGGRRCARVPSREKHLDEIVRAYDRIARVYARFEPLYLIFPPARRRAVAALALKPGDTVLELGAGTGRNLPYLVGAVGPRGTVIAVDASPGMLAEARRLIVRQGFTNVELRMADASRFDAGRELDAVLFSLSYSVIPAPEAALARAWPRLRPGGRVVVMDLGLTHGKLRVPLIPIARLLDGLAPGDPWSRPWDELARYGPVATKRFLLDLYYVCVVVKH